MDLSIKFIKIQQQNATDATVDSDVHSGSAAVNRGTRRSQYRD